MEIVQDSVCFVDGQTSMEYGVDPTSIQNVTDEEVPRGLMVNASMIISREMRPKLLCPKVDEKVAIPGVIQGDVEEVFVGKSVLTGESLASEGNVVMSSARTSAFLLLGVENSRSYS
jgi:hypothetical protein